MSVPTSGPPQNSGSGIFFFCGLLIVAVGIGLVISAQTEKRIISPEVKILATVPASVKSLHASNTPGLNNVFRLGDSLFSGGAPTEESAFASLSRLGVKTIVCVDGMVPDVDAAHANGIRYVHLPLSYQSLPHEDLVKLVQATRKFPGPFYIHCHHGKNRGPAAAVALWRCLDKTVSPDQAVATLVMMGTSEKYQALYASAQTAVCPSEAELKSVQDDLPEVATVEPLAKSMAVLDRMWDRVAEPTKERSSTTISNQLNTAYDIAEQLRESAELAEVTQEMRPGFQAIIVELERLADIIKVELRKPDETVSERQNVVAAIKKHCTECHARFRDRNSRNDEEVVLHSKFVR